MSGGVVVVHSLPLHIQFLYELLDLSVLLVVGVGHHLVLLPVCRVHRRLNRVQRFLDCLKEREAENKSEKVF